MLSKKMVGTVAAGLVAVGTAASGAPAHAATFTVNTTNNAGAGSLRSAILAAESTAVRDSIAFAIPGNGVHTIALANDLPVVTRPLRIRGYSQDGSSAASDTAPAAPTIVIDATNALRGLDIGGDDVEVRGLVVHSAQDTGIYVEGRRNVIAGNHVGTDASGTLSEPNGVNGVTLIGQGNRVGGPTAADRNVLSGNPLEVRVEAGTGHIVEGNRIGTDAAGTSGLGFGTGVLVVSSGNVLRDNLIADEFVGVEVWGDDNVLQGNQVGTDATGAAALPNGLGINLEGGDGNLIGGTATGEGNVVSGNDFGGIQIEPGDDGPADDNLVQGNLVGTTASGVDPLPNGAQVALPGIKIQGSTQNTIGGTDSGAANVIAANEGDGVQITADGNFVLGNRIGTDLAGTVDLGNGGSGVSIAGDDNHVGDARSAAANVIAHNDEDGVTVDSGVANGIVRNSMSSNGDLGIDLGADGPTPNDALDPDVGANNLQNGPEIDAATPSTVDWTLESTPSTLHRLDVYACDRAGSGEGQTHLGSVLASTDANGNADASTPLTIPALAGQHVSMTATRAQFVGFPPNLTLVLQGTSEFAPCEPVS